MKKAGWIWDVQLLLNTCDLDYEAKRFVGRMAAYGAGFGLGAALLLSNHSWEIAAYAGIGVFLLFEACVYALLIVTANRRVALIEDALPDFLGVMASNIRSGITYDRALILSSRKEFGPLANEIDRAAKEMLGGKQLGDVLMGMTNRVRSDMFSKTIRLIVEGYNSGGSLADLLENTASDIRRFGAVRKEVTATVMVYQLFLFAATGLGAPLLYSVSGFLVKTIYETKVKAATIGSADATALLPIAKVTVGLSPDLVFWFSLCAIVVTAVFGALAAGIVAKGKESEGFAYIPLLVFTGVGVFLFGRIFLESILRSLFFM